jgi:23S rRNA (cytidine1920-2'-O)/16S rRNA (cytidine1409-2'-O)-methyltransferase
VAAERLDAALAARGLARSRTHAARLISDGLVTVDGSPAGKASTRVDHGAHLVVAGADHYVSRAAHKLVAALDGFGIDVTGRLAFDAGASTGGFTQVLLERGARSVIAVDVGHGQFAPELAGASGLVLIEGCNVRYLTPTALAEQAGTEEAPGLVTADLSFISLTTVLPALRAIASPDADFLLLVKPQFEVGRTGIREGVVRDPALRADAVMGVLWAGHDLGLNTLGVLSSPIAGNHGNREVLVRLGAAGGEHPTQWLGRVSKAAGRVRPS